MLYALVENGVVLKVGNLPRAYKNISGFNLLPADKIKEYGFLPVENVELDFDNEKQRLGEAEFTVEADKVIMTSKVINLKAAELKDKKNQFNGNLNVVVNSFMYNTDWIFVEDAGLDNNQLAAYTGIRSKLKAIKNSVDNYDNKDLKKLVKLLNNLGIELTNRNLDLDVNMKALADFLNTL